MNINDYKNVKLLKIIKCPETSSEKICNVLLQNLIRMEHFEIRSIAVDQAVACALVTQRTLVRSPVRTSFLGEVFSGFFHTCKTNVGKFYAHQVLEYHLAVLITLSYSPCWNEWVCGWCVSSFMFVLSRRRPRH